MLKLFVVRCLRRLNLPIKNMAWYKLRYGDSEMLKEWRTFNLDLVTLGTTSVKYGVDYSSEKEIKAANWSMHPQSIESNFAILKNYHSFMKKDSVLLLLLCPFNLMSVNRDKSDSYFDRYHYFLSPVLVDRFNIKTYQRVTREINNPLFWNKKAWLKALLKTVAGKKHPQSPADMKAEEWIAGWKRQFSIENFADNLSDKHIGAIAFNVDQLCEIVNFCKDRSLRPVFGTMPISRKMKDMIPPEFMQRAFFAPIEELKKRTGVEFLDYFHSAEFECEDLFLKSFIMNETGSMLFTRRVLGDLKLY